VIGSLVVPSGVPAHLEPQAIGAFPEDLRHAVHDVIRLRRDIRHFHPDQEIAAEVLHRILEAAHLAPSVGFSQPWGFVLVRDRAVRERIRTSFLRCREAEAVRFPPGRRDEYLSHKLEGILEAPLNVCVAVDLRDQGEAILGTTVQPEAVRASACCAVQNLWLAARAEGIGVGWVSIVEPAVLRSVLALPAGVEPIAYLCLGHPLAFRDRPLLEETRWRPRRPLAEVVHAQDRWTEPPHRPAGPAPSREPQRAVPAAVDEAAREKAVAHQARLTKPVGSLGRLEDLATWYAGVRARFPVPPPSNLALALFAADHGVVVEGVSAYGSQVTAAMVANVMAGGAAVSALASSCGVAIKLVDVGVAGDLSAVPNPPVVPLVERKVRAGTCNLRNGPAMTLADAAAGLAIGEEIACELIAAGAEVVGVGEIGIGNTTSASALICALTGVAPAGIVGRGTGLDPRALQRKVEVVTAALSRQVSDEGSPLELLAALGGLEIAAMVGFVLQAARQRIPVVLDGVVTNAAALVARSMAPTVVGHLLASHRSAEPGATVALDRLGLTPLLDLGMRLGEGTGAVLGMHLLRTAVAAQHSMATFATAGIVGRSPFPTSEV
jgi:nicotinate-nucleotide--dimethylbenzimidazole phosphoribosyltransferase